MNGEVSQVTYAFASRLSMQPVPCVNVKKAAMMSIKMAQYINWPNAGKKTSKKDSPSCDLTVIKWRFGGYRTSADVSGMKASLSIRRWIQFPVGE